VAVGTAQIPTSHAAPLQGGTVFERSLRAAHEPATADERRVTPERGGTEPTNDDGANRRRGNVEMARAVLAENPERARRKPDSLGVSRVRSRTRAARGSAKERAAVSGLRPANAPSAARRPCGRCSRFPRPPVEGGNNTRSSSSPPRRWGTRASRARFGHPNAPSGARDLRGREATISSRETSRFFAKSVRRFGWTKRRWRPTFSSVAGTGNWTGGFRPARVGSGPERATGSPTGCPSQGAASASQGVTGSGLRAGTGWKDTLPDGFGHSARHERSQGRSYRR
jgi:hypothetical protein